MTEDLPGIHFATPEESMVIAARDIHRALAELDEAPPSHVADHIRMYLRSALIWLGED